ncbi:unnamed protein product [Mytilus edulis]|uniref:ISXO2-like transposase domain-containing protein n=2 Tax=Mytilus TaxID=6548 RepID=A0A8S3UR16_MYTED|nr:unnamed protein product [Mytilus edulis]
MENLGTPLLDRAPKAINWYAVVSSQESIVPYMMDNGLLKKEMTCTHCASDMNLCKRKDISDSLQWKCPACLLTSSIRRSSIFEKSKLPLRKLMELVYYFGIDLQIYEVEKLSDISHVSVIEWFDQFRIVCKESLTNDPVLLGSNSEHLIEIDESLFGKKRKYHRGTGKQDTWVFGMVEKGSRKVILQIVEKRDRKTLLPIIQENVAEGAHINSDCWAAYNTLEKEGFVHKTVNHSKEFKAQDGTCTNEIEGIWGLAKLKIKSMKGVRHERIGDILNEFCYRYRYGFSNGDVFHKFLKDIAIFNEKK